MPTTIMVNGHEATIEHRRWSCETNPALEAVLDSLMSPVGGAGDAGDPDLAAATEVARILGAELLGGPPVAATMPGVLRAEPASSSARPGARAEPATPRLVAPAPSRQPPIRPAPSTVDSEASTGSRTIAMDLARGRLETAESTYPILEGWVISAHQERRLPERHTQAPRVERRRAGAVPRAGGWWVVRGHVTVRATEGTEKLSVPPSRAFFLAQGIKFEVVSLQPVYQNTRQHSFVYQQSKARKWNFVALCQPSQAQLTLLLKAPVAGQGPLGRV